MGAPKGNNYWEFRNKHGRNHSYTPESLWTEAIEYFEWISNRVWNKKESIKSGDMAGTTMDVPTQTPMSINSFCVYADIDDNTFLRYEKEKGYEDFWEVTNVIKKIIISNQWEGATVGAYNPNIIARTLGLTDRQDVTTGGEKLPAQAIEVIIRRPEETDED